jgi:hypothetical protein
MVTPGTAWQDSAWAPGEAVEVVTESPPGVVGSWEHPSGGSWQMNHDYRPSVDLLLGSALSSLVCVAPAHEAEGWDQCEGASDCESIG